jgi:hypothetical protein
LRTHRSPKKGAKKKVPDLFSPKKGKKGAGSIFVKIKKGV